MTRNRRCLTFFVALLVIFASGKPDLEDLVPQEPRMWDTIEKLMKNQSITLPTVKLCLFKAVSIENEPRAWLQLGMWSTFGYESKNFGRLMPSACDTVGFETLEQQDIFDSLIAEDPLNQTKRDVSLAERYLQNAYLAGSARAPVLIYFLYFLKLVQGESVVEFSPQELVEMEKLLNEGNVRGDDFARVAIGQGVNACNRRRDAKIPGLEQLDWILDTPFGHAGHSSGCYSCQTALHLITQAAHNSLQAISKLGGALPDIPEINDETSFEQRKEKEKDEPLQQEFFFLKQNAANGNVQAQIGVAETYFFGNPAWGVERNVPQAELYFQQAAQQNNAIAHYSLGLIKLHGLSGEVNHSQAFDHIKKSTELGSREGYSGLAYLHLHGIGVEKNETLAEEYFEKAARLGHVEAASNLGILLMGKNLTRAIHYFKFAAARGHHGALLNLAILYNQGQAEALNMTCEEITSMIKSRVLYQGEAREFAKQAYDAYRQKDYERAILLEIFLAILGYPKAASSVQYLFKKRRTGDISCRLDDQDLCSVAYRILGYYNGELDLLDEFGDTLYFGTKSLNASHSAAFSIYNLSNTTYARFSKAYMLQSGEGVTSNVTAAREIYQSIVSDWNFGPESIVSTAEILPSVISLTYLRVLELANKLKVAAMSLFSDL